MLHGYTQKDTLRFYRYQMHDRSVWRAPPMRLEIDFLWLATNRDRPTRREPARTQSLRHRLNDEPSHTERCGAHDSTSVVNASISGQIPSSVLQTLGCRYAFPAPLDMGRPSSFMLGDQVMSIKVLATAV